MTSTYLRVRYLDDNTRKTVILMDPTDVLVAGFECLSGTEVGKDGNEIAPPGVDHRRRIIANMLIYKRTPLVMNNHYGELEPQKEQS